MKIEILKNKKGKYYWRIIARNGEILAHSESYSSRTKARKTVLAVIRFFGKGK